MVSTTQKVLKAMRIMLAEEKNRAGLSYKEVWTRLESIPALKKELYIDGKRREGIVVGLTTRIKENKIDGIKIIKKDNRVLYISHSNDFEFLHQVTSNFIEQVEDIKSNENYSKKQKELLCNYQELIYELRQLHPLMLKESEETKQNISIGSI
ncbi:hypothetical protein [Enterococcus sp. DIV0187]|uniref:hypothetical protein n=1 Tax=Enterococcus sp. DIV0187 TaxID=2774644 RepID=UPI003F298D4E